MTKLRLFIICFITLVSSYITRGSPFYFFTNYTVRDGLSNQDVRAIIQDKLGYIWIGTSSGLNRFNGSEFKIYKSLATDSSSICSNSISCLLIDHKNRLWVSGSGIALYDEKKDNFKRFKAISKNEISQNEFEVLFLFEDHKNNIWAGTNGIGLLKLNESANQFESALIDTNLYSAEALKSFKYINSILEDDDGNLWLSGKNHLIKYNPAQNKYQFFSKKLHFQKEYLQTMNMFWHSKDKNLMWLGSWGNGLVLFNKSTGLFSSYTFESGEPFNLSNIVLCAHIKNNGEIWLGTNRGIYKFNEAKREFISTISDSINDKPLVNILIKSFYFDSDNALWIGSQTGLSRLDPKMQYFISNRIWDKGINIAFPKIITDTIIGARYYNNRSLYIYVQNSKKELTYTIPGADFIRAEPFIIKKDILRNIWIGTTKGLYKYNPDEKDVKPVQLQFLTGIPDNHLYIQDIAEDKYSNIWIACSSIGLIKYIKKENKFFLIDPKKTQAITTIPSDIVKIEFSKNNKLIAYSQTEGLLEVDPDDLKIKNYNSIKNNYAYLKNITSFTIDDQNTIWLTTSNNGLLKLNQNGVLQNFSYDNSGEFIDDQQSLVVDKSGNIWLTASRGLFSFNVKSNSFYHFGAQDGLPYFTEIPNLYKSDDGNICFTFEMGLFKFNPRQFVPYSKQLNVHFTSLKVNENNFESNYSIDFIEKIDLKYNKNNLTIQFAATNFSSPSLTQYSYMIEGINNFWSNPTSTPILSFSNLAPGKYKLRIKAGSPTIPKNASEKILIINIEPAWWQTLAFKLIVFFAASFLLYFIAKYIISWRYEQQIIRMKNENEIEQMRARISRDIHDDIGAGLTTIKLLSHRLEKGYKEGEDISILTSRISTSSKELIQNLGEIVWTINPGNDSLINIVAYIRMYVSRYFDENPEVSLTLDLPEPDLIPKGIIINPEVKRHLLLIIKETLNNILKHSSASSVNIQLKVNSSELYIVITDNGIGFDNPNPGFHSGNGIRNMYKRASTIHADFKIKSNTNSGTVTSIQIPMK